MGGVRDAGNRAREYSQPKKRKSRAGKIRPDNTFIDRKEDASIRTKRGSDILERNTINWRIWGTKLSRKEGE